MRPNRLLSLLLIGLTAFTGLVTLCPEEGSGRDYSVHLISDSCAMHDCDPSGDHAGGACRPDECSHGVCGDVTIGDNYFPAAPFDGAAAAIPVRTIFRNEQYPQTGSSAPSATGLPDGSAPQRNLILRI
jgi:hypothetical protein